MANHEIVAHWQVCPQVETREPVNAKVPLTAPHLTFRLNPRLNIMEAILTEIESIATEMESIIAEKTMMHNTHLFLFLFHLLFILTNILILWAVQSYLQKWLGRKYPRLLRIGFILLFTISLLYPEYMQRLFINFESLYAVRSDANKCLELLRLEMLKDPIKTNYSYTHGSCTAIIRLSQMAVANQAAAETQIESLMGSVAARHFTGTWYISSNVGSEQYAITSLHCTNSWGGIARWIVEQQQGYSIGDSTQELTPYNSPSY